MSQKDRAMLSGVADFRLRWHENFSALILSTRYRPLAAFLCYVQLLIGVLLLVIGDRPTFFIVLFALSQACVILAVLYTASVLGDVKRDAADTWQDIDSLGSRTCFTEKLNRHPGAAFMFGVNLMLTTIMAVRDPSTPSIALAIFIQAIIVPWLFCHISDFRPWNQQVANQPSTDAQ